MYPDEIDIIYVYQNSTGLIQAKYRHLYKELCEKYQYKVVPVIDGTPYPEHQFTLKEKALTWIRKQLRKQQKDIEANLKEQSQRDIDCQSSLTNPPPSPTSSQPQNELTPQIGSSRPILHLSKPYTSKRRGNLTLRREKRWFRSRSNTQTCE